MVRIIDVCSGKGGVGKTTVSANLAVALQRFGRRVAIVDCNLTTSHLSICFGMHTYPRTLNDFMRGRCRLEDTIYNHPSGVKVIPASLDLKDLIDIDAGGLRAKIQEVFRDYDVVLLDSAPGIGKEAMIAIQASDNVLYVANPYLPSIIDIAKCNQLIREIGNRPSAIGVIINRARGRRYEIGPNDLSQFVELPIIGTIPEDESVLESTNMKSLVTFSHPYSSASIAIFEIAARMIGVPYSKPSLIKIMIERLRGPQTVQNQNQGIMYPIQNGMI